MLIADNCPHMLRESLRMLSVVKLLLPRSLSDKRDLGDAVLSLLSVGDGSCLLIVDNVEAK